MLKIKQTSEFKMPLTVAGKFAVMVRRLGPQQAKELSRRCTRPKHNRQTGAMEDSLDDELWLKLAPEYYIDAAECTGLTPATFGELGIELDEMPETDADGNIPVTAELIRDLWENADADRFVRPVLRFSREMLSAVELAKKNDSTN